MFARQVRLARGISVFLDASEDYELLGQGSTSKDVTKFDKTHIIVIFRAKDENTNAELVKRINATRRLYVSGTKWDGKPACRVAISTWKVEVDRDLELVQEVLQNVAKPRP